MPGGLPVLCRLGGSSIWDANEAFYVETPREMMERGDYIGPTFNYQPRFNKPVLSYWIVAGFYKAFGVSVGVQRVPIALGAVAMILTAFFLARSGAVPPNGSPHLKADAMEAALWAAVGLAVAPRLMMFGRRIFIDIYISMFMAGTLLFFALAERYPARRRLFLLLMYASVGLGVLTKGPVAAALPGLVFALYLVVHGELRRVREMMIPTRRPRRRRHRRALVRRALSPLRLDLHHFVLPRRERCALHRGRWRGDPEGAALLTCRLSSAIRFRGRSACSARPACGLRNAGVFGRSR